MLGGGQAAKFQPFSASWHLLKAPVEYECLFGCAFESCDIKVVQRHEQECTLRPGPNKSSQPGPSQPAKGQKRKRDGEQQEKGAKQASKAKQAKTGGAPKAKQTAGTRAPVAVEKVPHSVYRAADSETPTRSTSGQGDTAVLICP